MADCGNCCQKHKKNPANGSPFTVAFTHNHQENATYGYDQANKIGEGYFLSEEEPRRNWYQQGNK